MALRAGHGTGAGMPRIEVLPADELPVGLPDAARPESPKDRDKRGRFAPGNGLASKGDVEAKAHQEPWAFISGIHDYLLRS